MYYMSCHILISKNIKYCILYDFLQVYNIFKIIFDDIVSHIIYYIYI